MSKKESTSNANLTLDGFMEVLITCVKRTQTLSKINPNLSDKTLQILFKDIETDHEEALPSIVVVSTVLGLIICRILRHWSSAIPSLSSDVKILDIVDTTIKFDKFIDPLLWDNIRGYTQLLQQIIPHNLQTKLKALLAICNLHELLQEDIMGSLLQKYLPRSLRKALAANYTSLFSSELLARLAIIDDDFTVVDPFCGSGRLLTAILDVTASQQNVSVRVEGTELFGTATILALARVLFWFKTHHRIPNLNFSIEDAFERIPNADKALDSFSKADLVIMNPPFTRYLRLQPAYLKRLLHLFEPYSDFMQKQMGLHVFAMFLADRLLKPGGRLAAVLPAPTFYSKYADGLKRFLLSKYQLKFMIGTTIGKAFSEGSNLKEILFIADKQKPNPAMMHTVFATIETDLTKDLIPVIAEGFRSNNFHNIPVKVNKVSHQNLASDWNWIRFLEIGAHQDLAARIRQIPLVKSAKHLNLRIIRGFEMYGPDFFFIPNKFWNIVQPSINSDSVIVQHKQTNQQFEFLSKWLVKAFRKPSLYNSWITPQIDHYALNISNTLDPTLLDPYVAATPQTWNVAKKRFGSTWITHIHSQLNSKRPYGHLFLVDKFGITTTGILAHFTDQRLTASKNFYVIDCPIDQAKLLAAWMNSTIFVLLFLASRREIGGAYGRLQIIDYQNEPLFLDIHKIDPTILSEINLVFDSLRSQQLPPIKEQLTLDLRQSLDLLFLKALGFQKSEGIIFRDALYCEIERLFREMDHRSKHKRKRS